MSRTIKAKTLIKKGTSENAQLIDLQVINGRFRVYTIDDHRFAHLPDRGQPEYPEILGHTLTMESIIERAYDTQTVKLLDECELHEIEIHI